MFNGHPPIRREVGKSPGRSVCLFGHGCESGPGGFDCSCDQGPQSGQIPTWPTEYDRLDEGDFLGPPPPQAN